MAAGFRFYRAEDIGGAAAFIFVVLSGLAARFGVRGGSNVGMQGDRLFVQADHGFLRIVRPLIGFQNVFHFGDVVLIEFGHAPHFFPATA